MVEFANGKILTTHLGRTLTNGYEATTRLCGTKGHTLINSDCRINGVEIRDAYGVRTLTTPDAFVLHARSFINDLAEFADAVLDGKPLCYDGRDGQRDLAATLATIQSAIEGRAVLLDSVPQDWTAYRNA